MIKKIDHIAIAVKDLAAEITRYRDVLGLEYLGSEVVAEQKVTVAFFRINDVLIELLEPTGADSPISAFIEKKAAACTTLLWKWTTSRPPSSVCRKKTCRCLTANRKPAPTTPRSPSPTPKVFPEYCTN